MSANIAGINGCIKENRNTIQLVLVACIRLGFSLHRGEKLKGGDETMKGSTSVGNGKGEKQNERQTIIQEFHPDQGLAYPDTKPVSVKEILNKEIVVRAFTQRMGKYGDVVIVKASVDGEDVSFASGSQVLIKQLNLAKERVGLPFRGTITLKKRYYTFK